MERVLWSVGLPMRLKISVMYQSGKAFIEELGLGIDPNAVHEAEDHASAYLVLPFSSCSDGVFGTFACNAIILVSKIGTFHCLAKFEFLVKLNLIFDSRIRNYFVIFEDCRRESMEYVSTLSVFPCYHGKSA